jgi:hypothetical protein
MVDAIINFNKSLWHMRYSQANRQDINMTNIDRNLTMKINILKKIKYLIEINTKSIIQEENGIG